MIEHLLDELKPLIANRYEKDMAYSAARKAFHEAEAAVRSKEAEIYQFVESKIFDLNAPRS